MVWVKSLFLLIPIPFFSCCLFFHQSRTKRKRVISGWMAIAAECDGCWKIEGRKDKLSWREMKKKQHQRDDDDEMEENFPLLCAFFSCDQTFVFFHFSFSRRPFSRINNGHFLMPHNTTNPLMLLMFWLFISTLAAARNRIRFEFIFVHGKSRDWKMWCITREEEEEERKKNIARWDFECGGQQQRKYGWKIECRRGTWTNFESIWIFADSEWVFKSADYYDRKSSFPISFTPETEQKKKKSSFKFNSMLEK